MKSIKLELRIWCSVEMPFDLISSIGWELVRYRKDVREKGEHLYIFLVEEISSINESKAIDLIKDIVINNDHVMNFLKKSSDVWLIYTTQCAINSIVIKPELLRILSIFGGGIEFRLLSKMK